MQPFRATRGGGVRASLAGTEASLLRSLIGQVMTLIGDVGEEIPGDLESLLDQPPAQDQKAPEDPVLARLLPDGYRDDPEAAGEFRRYTEPGLRSGKVAAAQTVLATLPPAGGRVRLSAGDAEAWLRSLNDVRLALGVVLGISEDYESEFGTLDPEDPRQAYLHVYDFLTYLQETLVRALH